MFMYPIWCSSKNKNHLNGYLWCIYMYHTCYLHAQYTEMTWLGIVKLLNEDYCQVYITGRRIYWFVKTVRCNLSYCKGLNRAHLIFFIIWIAPINGTWHIPISILNFINCVIFTSKRLTYLHVHVTLKYWLQLLNN